MRQSCTIFLSYIILLSSCGRKTEEIRPVRKDVTETIFASGTLEAASAYTITAETDGTLQSVRFEEGDTIVSGQVLAILHIPESSIQKKGSQELYNIALENKDISSPILQQAQKEVDIAKKKLDFDQRNFERYQQLWEANSIAKTELEKIEQEYKTSLSQYQRALEGVRREKKSLEQQIITTSVTNKVNALALEKNIIRSYTNGKVYTKYKQSGDFVKKGEAIALIGSADFIYAKVSVDEENIDKVETGQTAFVQLNTNKSKVYNAKVTKIYPSFDNTTQSFQCRLDFTDSLLFMIIHTQLQCNIVIQEIKNALLIPRRYLDFSNRVQVKGEKQKRLIQTGFVSNDWVQVTGGLSENTLLVTENISEQK